MAGRPFLMTPILVVVPPTSKYTPLEARRYIKLPMTEAAGPDSIVSTGRFFISLISITPPSPRIIIKGTVTPASRTEASVELAVSSILGKMDALIAAVRVRRVRPYSLVISEAIVVGRPLSVHTWYTRCSGSLLSTPNAIEDTMTCAP